MQRLLDQPVHHRRHPSVLTPPCGFGISTRRTGCGRYGPPATLPSRSASASSASFELGTAHVIDARGALVSHDPLIRQLHVAALDHLLP